MLDIVMPSLIAMIMITILCYRQAVFDIVIEIVRYRYW